MRPKFHVTDHESYGAGIAEFAVDVGADLIVLGRNDRWTIEDAMLGSTAERVARRASCSVLAIRPDAGAERLAIHEAENAEPLASAV